MFSGFLSSYLFICSFFAFILLLYIIENETSYKKIFLCGLITQFVTISGGFYWLVYTIHIFGNLNTFISILLFLLYVTFFGLKFPLFMILSKFTKDRTNLNSLIIYPVIYTLIEFIFPDLFPWFIANTQVKNYYLIQIADITGVYGITFTILMINVTLFELYKYLIKKRNLPKQQIIITGVLLLTFYCYGIIRTFNVKNIENKARPIKIGSIQPCTPLVSKDRIKQERNIRLKVFKMTEELLKKHRIDILIWPESAAQFIYKSPEFMDAYRKPIEEFVKKYKVYFIFSDIEKTLWGINRKGILEEYIPFLPNSNAQYRSLRELRIKYYSTAVLLDRDANIIGNYRKNYPLAFAEYMPLSETFPFLKTIFAEVGDFSAGDTITVFKTDLCNFAPSICYEIIIPSFTRKFLLQDSNLIINLTNDAWFGDTRASHEHLSLALFRAIENRVPIVRATNSGISTCISATGTFTVPPTETFTDATIVSEVKPIKIWSFYTKMGDVFGYIVLIAGIFLFVFGHYLRFKETGKIWFIRLKRKW